MKNIIKKLRTKFAFYLINGIYAGKSNYERKRRLLVKAGYEIGVGTKIVGPIYISANVKIGDNCWIGKDIEIQGNGIVEIGNNCDFGPNVIINTGGHQIGDSTRRAGKCITNKIIFKDGCWIGLRSTFINTITIEAGCIIGACSFVNKNTEPNCLYFGSPAKKIRNLS